MGPPPCREDGSLLSIVVSNYIKQEDNSGWDEVLKWFDSTTNENEARAATNEVNNRGETALHIILKRSARGRQHDQQLDVVRKFADIDSEAFRVQDARGNLPLHNACQDGTCDFEVVRELIKVYPAGLAVTNKDRCTPFGWDYSISLGEHFTKFLRYVVATDVCESGAKQSTIAMRKERHAILRHCKDYVPLDILKKGMLNERTLESSAMIRFLNEMPCKRTVVCSMVFELYLHIAWIVTFVHATALHIETDEQLKGWEPLALLAFAALFLLQEFYQMYRFYKTHAGISYWLDFWNWIDLTASGLVTASAIKMLQHDESVQNDQLLIATGFFQFVLLVSYLKKTFFPFSKFVSGVIKIFWSLMPFFVVSVITLFAFSFMYYVFEKDSDPYYDPMPHTSPNPYATLIDSFKTTYTPFASGPEGNENILDFLFGFTIVIVLLNVVIAVVTEAWEDASEEANEAFWSYRLDLILEKTRGVGDRRFSRDALFGCMEGLDETFIDIDTVGTTTEEILHKLSVTNREKGSFAVFLVVAKSLALIALGFPTFGVLWPKFFRQILFTPPKPKEDEAKVRMDSLAEEVASCKELSKEREVGYRKLQSDVEKLTERVDMQLDLMHRILLKNESPHAEAGSAAPANGES